MIDSPAVLYKSPESYDVMRAFYDSSVAKLPVAVESRYVDTRFGSTHMLAVGPEDAPPLLLLQGMAGSAILWHQQFADFARKRRVYALDTIGQPGRSAPNPLPLTDDSYALWLRDVLDGLGYARADMGGVSLGGWIIMRLGIIAPQRIRKAILLSPLRLARARMNVRRWVANAAKPETQDESLEDRLSVRDFSPSEGKREFDRQLARAMALATKHYRLGVGMGIDPADSRLRKFLTGARVLVKFSTPAPRNELARFRIPCLVVMGEHEMLYSSQAAAGRARFLPHATVHIAAGAGHAAIYDQPEVINPIILDFLERPLA